MKRSISIFELSVGMLGILMLIGAFVMYLVSSGTISVTFNQEFKVAELEFEVVELQNQISSFKCPEVKCKDSPIQMIWGIALIILYFSGLGVYIYKSNQMTKKEAALSDREKELLVREAEVKHLKKTKISKKKKSVKKK